MTFDWSVVWRNIGVLLQGAEVTVALTCITMALAIPGGLLLGSNRAPGRLGPSIRQPYRKGTGSPATCTCQ